MCLRQCVRLQEDRFSPNLAQKRQYQMFLIDARLEVLHLGALLNNSVENRLLIILNLLYLPKDLLVRVRDAK